MRLPKGTKKTTFPELKRCLNDCGILKQSNKILKGGFSAVEWERVSCAATTKGVFSSKAMLNL